VIGLSNLKQVKQLAPLKAVARGGQLVEILAALVVEVRGIPLAEVLVAHLVGPVEEVLVAHLAGPLAAQNLSYQFLQVAALMPTMVSRPQGLLMLLSTQSLQELILISLRKANI
jgi:hypothetical protein